MTDGLPGDPWDSGNPTTDALEQGRQLFEALVEQRSVVELFRAVSALGESELYAIVLERALSAMAERRLSS